MSAGRAAPAMVAGVSGLASRNSLCWMLAMITMAVGHAHAVGVW